MLEGLPDYLFQWQYVVLSLLLTSSYLVGVVAILLNKKKWKKKSEEVSKELIKAQDTVSTLSKVTEGIVLGVENVKENLPKRHKKKVSSSIREVTEEKSVESLVHPIVKSIKDAGTVADGLRKILG